MEKHHLVYAPVTEISTSRVYDYTEATSTVKGLTEGVTLYNRFEALYDTLTKLEADHLLLIRLHAA